MTKNKVMQLIIMVVLIVLVVLFSVVALTRDSQAPLMNEALIESDGQPINALYCNELRRSAAEIVAMFYRGTPKEVLMSAANKSETNAGYAMRQIVNEVYSGEYFEGSAAMDQITYSDQVRQRCMAYVK